MIETVTPEIVTITQAGGAAELSQPEVYQRVRQNISLNLSFWANIGLAGLSVLLFVYMGRNVKDSRSQLIFVSTLMVPLVSLSSYLGLASGLTISFLEMPAGHALAGEQILTMWGRYLTWALSTPMILLALGLLAGSNLTKLFTIIVMDIGMCVTGLAAALTTSSYGLRWVWYLISCAFFAAVLYILLVEWPKDAEVADTDDIFNVLRNLTVALWFGYPIFWALGSEGFAVLSVATTSWGYSLLDIGAKYVFAFLLLRWVAAHQGIISKTATTGIGTGGRTTVD